MAELLVLLLLLLLLLLRRKGMGVILSCMLPITLLLLFYQAFLSIDVLLSMGQEFRKVSRKLLKEGEIKITSMQPPL